MAWCLEDEKTSYTERVLSSFAKGYSARVPYLWSLEVSNVLLLAERKKRINLLQATNFKNALGFLPITSDELGTKRVFDTVFTLANELKLTIYDACYLELALRESLPLVTLDKGLIHAAQKIAVVHEFKEMR
jgi:predicted nucleic acid-binding protein